MPEMPKLSQNLLDTNHLKVEPLCSPISFHDVESRLNNEMSALLNLTEEARGPLNHHFDVAHPRKIDAAHPNKRTEKRVSKTMVKPTLIPNRFEGHLATTSENSES
jgi:hypothetical protein